MTEPTTTTYADVATATRTGHVPDHLDHADPVPTINTTGGRQGDVCVLPWTGTPRNTGQALAEPGVNVVAGDIGRNRHVLVGAGTWHPGPVVDRERDFGVLVVPDGATCWLFHTGEHGSWGIPTGTWRVFGQLDPQTRARVAD